MLSRLRAAAFASVLLVASACAGSDTGDDLAAQPSPRAEPSSSSVPSSGAPTSIPPGATSPATSPPAPAASSADPVPTPPPTGPGTRALFFGDSYIVGGGYTGPDDSMAAVAADELGWEREIAGAGGTGFVSGNPEFGLANFIGQIRDGALDVGPVDWLVIEGGGNDKDDDPELIERRAVEVLTEAGRAHPEARLVLVGTLDPTVDGFTDTDGVIGALAAAAERVGVTYVDAQRWLEGRPDLVGPDFDHPLPEGHALLGRKLARALLTLARR